MSFFSRYFVVMTSKRQLYPMYAVEKKLGKFRTVSTSHTLKFLQKIVTPKYPPSRPGGTPENGPAPVRVSLPLTESVSLSAASTRETTPDQELEGTSMKSHILGLYLNTLGISASVLYASQFFFYTFALYLIQLTQNLERTMNRTRTRKRCCKVKRLGIYYNNYS